MTTAAQFLLLAQRPSASGGGASVAGRLRTDGRFFVNDAGTYRCVWTDALSILAKPSKDRDAYLDWVRKTGFGGIRVFCGDLGWALPEPQTPASALAALPGLMDACARRGLYVEVTALTGTNLGYDVEAHLQAIDGILEPYVNAVVEIANEPYHDTQSELVHDPDYLLEVSGIIDMNIITALGAAYDDESDEFSSGDYVTVHLDRGRDDWNMVRRVRELENLSSTTGKHVVNNEPKKAGSQLADPAIVFTMAVLNRGFEVGGIFHSDAGLDSVLPDAAQQHFAEEYIAGAHVISTADRLNFQNAGWHTSPVKSANFTDNTNVVDNPEGLVRAYSFVSGPQSVLVEVGAGANTNIVLQNGYRFGTVLAERVAFDRRVCRVTELLR
jgi:sugar phosphate isomerase/epimerase